MSRPLIIGVLGVAGSGKTLVAKHLAEMYGYRRTRFADPLKRMLKLGLGLTDDEVDGDLKATPVHRLGGATPRHLMQTLGTEWGRRLVHHDIWVNMWRHEALTGIGPVVVDDVRFHNEAQAIKSLGGVLWRVHRPGLASSDQHASERQNRGISEDMQIVNATTISALICSVDALISESEAA